MVFYFRVQWVQLLWEVIIRFVDIGGICHHHCFNFLFMCTLGNKKENTIRDQNLFKQIGKCMWSDGNNLTRLAMHIFCFQVSTSLLWCPLRFPSINDVLFLFNFIRLIGKFMFDLCYLYLFTYTVVQTGLPYQVLFVSFNSNLMGATSKADIDYPTWAPGFTPAI